ncbi:MAG: hypothetical protein IT555_07805 [Acetobacteraceae bacterium]|nr:hypothetical protein [Acetobacteraceae bacterium]
MPAERLRRGGAVLGAGGAVLTLSDLRHLTLPAEMFRRLGLAAPVLVAAGALAPGVPSVPLLLGPAQLVRQAGGWLAAASLVDGIGVRHRDRGVRMVLLGHGGDAPILAAGAMLAPAGTMPAGPGAAGATGAGLIPACEALLRLADASGHPTRHLDGYVDHADRFGLVGWARDAAAPQRVVPLEVLVAGTVVARVLADQPRPDLPARPPAAPGPLAEPMAEAVADRASGTLRHGFALRFATPLPAGRIWMVTVRRAGSGPSLPGTPLLLDAAAPSAERFDMALAGLGGGAREVDMLARLVGIGAGGRFR